MPRVLAIAALLTALVAAPAQAATRGKTGYWDGRLGGSGPRTQVELLVRADGFYMLRLRTTLIAPDGRRVPFRPTTRVFCPPDRDCGPQGDGFGFAFDWTSRTTMRGRWFLDRGRYPGYRIPKGKQRLQARWRADPRLRITPSPAKAGSAVTVIGTGFIPRLRLYSPGNRPIYRITDTPHYADRYGRFRVTVTIPATTPSGTYPDVFVYQRECLATCWVRGSTSLTILSP